MIFTNERLLCSNIEPLRAHTFTDLCARAGQRHTKGMGLLLFRTHVIMRGHPALVHPTKGWREEGNRFLQIIFFKNAIHFAWWILQISQKIPLPEIVNSCLLTCCDLPVESVSPEGCICTHLDSSVIRREWKSCVVVAGKLFAYSDYNITLIRSDPDDH